jgi:AcrR family transcriptional regulator
MPTPAAARGPSRARRDYYSLKRETAAAKTNARIMSAAAKHLRSPHFMRSLSLESVAKAAGVSRLTVYNQFGSRRGLLEAVFDDKARRGGLNRIPAAMAEPDPQVSLLRVVQIFCEFWYFHGKPLGRILAASVADPQFDRAIRARNERRRKILAAIVARLDASGEVGSGIVTCGSRDDVVDVLFVLTSHAIFSGLAIHGRSVEEVCRLVQALVLSALQR